MIGTVIGAIAIVSLTACFPQSRIGFLLSLALWGGLCAVVATLLRNFAAYAAALAGYTAAIIAGDELGAVGGANGDAFMLALTRVSEIWIGIICAGIVLAGTDFGGAPRRLARLLASVTSDIARRSSLMLASPESASETQTTRRELTKRVISLDPVIDEALGESSRLRYHSPLLDEAVYGLLAALGGWRTCAARLTRLPKEDAREETDAVLRNVPDELLKLVQSGDPALWIAHPIRLRLLCDASVKKLMEIQSANPSLQMLAEQTARIFAGLSNALEGLALLVADPLRTHSGRRSSFQIPDWLPALVNGARAAIMIGVVELIWIATGWPNGALAITWTSIVVILLAPRADEAYDAAVKFSVGIGLAAIFAGILLFVLLPKVDSFAGFSAMLGLYMVPVGALMAQPWLAVMFTSMAGNFLPLLSPANQMVYDATQFFNSAIAIVAGCCIAALSFRLLPPVSPALRSRRLLDLSLRDLRKLATNPSGQTLNGWEHRMYARIAVLPDRADPLQRAQLIAVLSVGIEIILLQRSATELRIRPQLSPAFHEIAQGNGDIAIARLKQIDEQIAANSGAFSTASLATRARGRILAISDALAQHREYFDAGASR